jgi:hypothetical protein
MEESIDDEVDIEEDGDGGDEIEEEEEGAEVALGLDIHRDFSHEEGEEDAVEDSNSEILVLAEGDGLDVVEQQRDDC